MPPPIPGVELVVGSIADGALVRQVLADRRIEAVLHFAALKSVEESVAEPGRYFEANVGGSATLLRAMEATGVRRLVFSSTCAVYGEPSRVPIDEDAPTRPENPYGESKALVERMLPWFEPRRPERGHAPVLQRRRRRARWCLRRGLGPGAQSGARWRSGPLWATDRRCASSGRTTRRPTGRPSATTSTSSTSRTPTFGRSDISPTAVSAVTLNLGTGTGSSVRAVIAAVQEATGRRDRRPWRRRAVRAIPRRSGRTRRGRPRSLAGGRGSASTRSSASAVRWHRAHPAGYLASSDA